MKRFFFPILSLIAYNCFQTEDGSSNNPPIQHQTTRIESFPFVSDSITMRFILDVKFKKTRPSFVIFGSDKSFGYSNEKDSIFVLVYWNAQSPSFTDYKNLKEYFAGRSISSNEINITNRGTKQYVKFNELLTPYNYLTCQVIDSTKQVSFQILYQTYKIDSISINTFNKMCDSFTFEIFEK